MNPWPVATYLLAITLLFIFSVTNYWAGLALAVVSFAFGYEAGSLVKPTNTRKEKS